MKTAIVTGITGQDGAYISKLLLKENYKVIGLSRNGDTGRLKKLNILDKLKIINCDLLNYENILNILKEYKPDEFYNFAGVSSVGESFYSPGETLNFNISSVINILEAIRNFNKSIKFLQASSSEIYGVPKELPVTEEQEIEPINIYASSKASAYYIVKSYRRLYDMYAVSAILFNHESVLRGDNFVIKKIVRESVKIKNGLQDYLVVGNTEVKRDFGYAPAYMEATHLMMQQNKPSDYIIASGESVAIKDVISYVFKKLSISSSSLKSDVSLYRSNDIEDIYGSNDKIKSELGWVYNMSIFDAVDEMIDAEMEKY